MTQKSPNSLNRCVGKLSAEQLYRVGELCKDKKLTARAIAKEVRADLKYVQPIVAAFRKCNDMMDEDQDKQDTHLQRQIAKAQHPPGPGKDDDIRDATGWPDETIRYFRRHPDAQTCPA